MFRTVLADIRKLNNEAVTRLDGSDFSVATRSLDSALGLVDSLLSFLESQDSEDDDSQRSSTNEASFVKLKSSGANKVYEKSLVFSRPIFLPDPIPNRLSTELCCALACMLKYNKALAFHLKVLRDQDTQEAGNLIEVLRLYHATLDTLNCETEDNSPSHALVKAAIMNNMGDVYNRLQNRNEAKKCREILSSHLGHVLGEFSLERFPVLSLFPLVLERFEANPASAA